MHILHGEICTPTANRNLPPDTYVNIMGQYRPAGSVHTGGGEPRHDEVARPITGAELRGAISAARAAGLHRFEAAAFPEPW